MLPLTRSRNRARFFGIPFSPSSLFSAGEQGAWYDPSDLTTLFTDSAGTVPVTGVEQFVGLMLDKSKGLVLGSELVTNGDFSNGTTNWSVYSASATFAVVGGAGTVTTVTSSGGIYQDFSGLTIGRTYRFSVLVIAGTANAIIQIGTSPFTGAAFQQIGANGQITGVFVASATTLSISLRVNNASAGQTCSFDNISIRELPGNHATSTGTKRPKLAARYNLLTYTEQFDNGAWTKSNVTVAANAAVAPNGTTTADRLVTNNGSNALWYLQQIPSIASQSLKFNIFAKADAAFHIGFSIDSGVRAGVNLSTGTITLNDFGITVVGLSDGWYNISWSSTGDRVRVFCSTTAITVANQSVTGDGTSGIYIWGADLRPASQATGLIGPTYQRVVDAATYDTAGFLPYLQFDGIDDSMSTGSIDFTATDKMTVWAGVRKLSDASQMIAELSANADTNNGAFNIAVVTGGVLSGSAYISVRGTSLLTTGSNTNTAPVTYLHTGQYDIVAATNKLISRVNATQVATSGATSAGTGNFGNYPLYIGQRGGSSLPLNGNLYSLIVRGAQSTDSQINATESWVAGKTGVQLTTQSTISVQNSGGTAYSVPLTVLNSSGNSYTVTNTVLSSNGTSYTV
jgi:hypothetical protein